MQSRFMGKFSNISNLNLRSINGKWKDIPCKSGNYVLCQKYQSWSFLKLQKAFLDVRNELNDTKNQLDNTKNQLNNTRNGLNGTRHELERMINQRLEGIEGAFMRTFEVGGSINYYCLLA